MNELAESVSLKKLPVFATIREAIECLWHHRAILVRWIIGCTIFASGFCYLMEFLFAHFNWVYADWKPIWVRVSYIFLSAIPLLMVHTLFSVFCHRLVLTDGKKEFLYPIAIGKRDWRFFRWSLTLSLAAILIAFLVLIVGVFVLGFGEGFRAVLGNQILRKAFLDSYLFPIAIYALLHGVGSGLLAPYCLVLPAIAMDIKPSLAWSLEQTKRNKLRLALLFGGLPFIFGFLYCPPSLLTWLQIDQLVVVKHVVRPFLIYLVTPIIVIAISIAFRELTNWTPSTFQPEKATPVA